MEIIKYSTALIVGAGAGLSASLARLFTREGIRVALAARKRRSSPRFAKKPAPRPLPVMRRSPDEVRRCC